MEAPRCRRIVLKAVATTCESSEIIHAASDVSTRTQALIAFSLTFCIMFFFFFLWTKSSCCAILHRRVKTRSCDKYTSNYSYLKAIIRVITCIVKGSTGDKGFLGAVWNKGEEYCMDQQKDAQPVVRRARW